MSSYIAARGGVAGPAAGVVKAPETRTGNVIGRGDGLVGPLIASSVAGGLKGDLPGTGLIGGNHGRVRGAFYHRDWVGNIGAAILISHADLVKAKRCCCKQIVVWPHRVAVLQPLESITCLRVSREQPGGRRRPAKSVGVGRGQVDRRGLVAADDKTGIFGAAIKIGDHYAVKTRTKVRGGIQRYKVVVFIQPQVAIEGSGGLHRAGRLRAKHIRV